MISGRYSRISSMSDVPFYKDLEFEIEGNSSKQQLGSGPYYEFYCVSFFESHARCSFMYVCMYVCMHVCMCIYVSQGDFRLMSFTAGRCSMPLIPNDQLRRNGVRSSDLIPNDQLRRNGVRSSDLIVCVHPVLPSESRSRRAPIGGRAKRVRRGRTESPRRPSEVRPPASDRKDFTNRTALVVQYAFDPERSVT